MFQILIVAYLVIVITILIAFHMHITHRRIFLLANEFPGPKAVPIFGNALSFLRRKPIDLLNFSLRKRKEFGRICRFWAFKSVEFSIADPKVVEIIMSSSKRYTVKGRVYGVIRPWLGEGLLLSSGQKWHKRRKIITPAFHFTILKQFVEIFDRQSRILVSRLSSHCDDQVVDIQPFISKLALDVVCETAMGVQINAQIDSESEYVKAVNGITEAMAFRLSTYWLRNDILFNLIGGETKRKIIDCLRVLHNFSNSIILKRREELMKNSNASEHQNSVDADDGKRMALLDILLHSEIDGQPLSNEDIREEVDTFMFEGHDTTTIGISFTLYTISRHKTVQDKLFAEIRSVCGDDKSAPISYQQLHELKYIDSVIKESMRMYPPVPGISRYADADIHLDDGRILPKGSMLNINLFIIFRDPEYFPRPTNFDPDRFIDGTLNDKIADKPSSFAYIPFSAGTRNCIGQKYAMLEMKSVISNILRNFELLAVGDEPDLRMELVLRTKNGVQLGLKPRKYD